MRKTLLALAAAAAVATVASVSMPTKAEAQVFVYSGARYCFYFDGWHGPGWYRCGYRWRQGLGWGGVYGWHGWRHHAWERRGHRGGDVNVRIRSGERDGMRTRERTTIRSGERSTIRGERSTIRSGGEMRGNARIGGEMRTTTGAGRPGPAVQGGGRMEMRSGAPGGGAAAPAPRQGGEKKPQP